MVGANILELILLSCREALFKLVERLLSAANEQTALDDTSKDVQVNADEGTCSANSGGNGSGGAAIVSDPSEKGFAMVVKVKSHTRSPGTGEDVSDSMGNAEIKSPERSPRTPGEINSGTINAKDQFSGGVESSTSAVAKQLHNTHKAFDNNVMRHNTQLLNTKGDFLVNKLAHKDDVTAASVTVNNAGAHLSSLQVNTTLESGESDPLREDSASSTNDTPNTGSSARQRPLAPTCNVTLIRDDLTTILCEVTSSIRTRSLSDANYDAILLSGGRQTCPGEKGPNGAANCKENNNSIVAGSNSNVQGVAGAGDMRVTFVFTAYL